MKTSVRSFNVCCVLGITLLCSIRFASAQFSSTGAMSEPRHVHQATLLPDGSVLVTGGRNASSAIASADRYFPASGTFVPVGPMNVAHDIHTATALLDGRVLVVGGGNGLGGAFDAVEIFDPVTSQFTLTGSLNIGRIHHAAIRLNDGRVLVCGGDTHQTAEVFDPVTETWTLTGSMSVPRVSPAIALLPDGRVLVAGGVAGAPTWVTLASAEVFDPVTGTFSAAQPMSAPRAWASATTLPSGQVLISGGVSAGYTAHSNGEVFDPVAGTWSVTGNMAIARSFHCATLLNNGQVLVTGGLLSNGSGTVANGELFDPATGTFSLAGTMVNARWNFTATRLLNGKVLLAGGRVDDGATYYLAAAELFTPTTANSAPVARAKNVTVSAGNDCFANASVNDGSFDPDGDDVTIVQSPAGPYPIGSTTVTLTVTDVHGASDSAQATVTVVDSMAPTIVCPENIILPCSLEALVPVTFTVTASDLCDASPSVSCSSASGSGFPIGTTVVTCTATDASGNETTRSFTVTRAPLQFAGFESPLGGADETGGSFSRPVRTFKSGSTIPVKFSIACDGSPILTGRHTLRAIKYSDTTTAGTAIDASPQDAATSGNQFRLADNRWQFNLDTKATGLGVGIWKLIATMSDASEHSVWIQIK